MKVLRVTEKSVVSIAQGGPVAGNTTPAAAEPPRPRVSYTPSSAAFEERRSQTLRQAERYSRVVRTLKILLPLSAFAVLVASMLFVLLYDADDALTVSFTSVQRLDNDLRMVNPRFSGVDNERRPFLVTATSAIQDAADPRTVTLETIQADMSLSEEAWVSVSANRGVLDTETETLTLEGDISVFSDSGYEFHTQNAQVRFDDRSVAGNAAVNAHGPLGTLSADSFSADGAGDRIRFDGNVRMRIYPPNSADPSSADPASAEPVQTDPVSTEGGN